MDVLFYFKIHLITSMRKGGKTQREVRAPLWCMWHRDQIWNLRHASPMLYQLSHFPSTFEESRPLGRERVTLSSGFLSEEHSSSSSTIAL